MCMLQALLFIYGINRICLPVGIGCLPVSNGLCDKFGQKIYAAGLMLAGLSGDGYALARFGFPMPVVEREDIPCEKKVQPDEEKRARVFTAVCRGFARRSKNDVAVA